MDSKISKPSLCKRPRREVNAERRHKESSVFQEISDALPVSTHLGDKASQPALLRMVINYLKTRDLVSKRKPQRLKLRSLNSMVANQFHTDFTMIADLKGEILYISESIADFLGPVIVDVVGQSVEDLVHSEDREQMSRALDLKYLGQRNMFVIRMKKTMASTVRSQERVDYEPVFVTSHLKQFESSFSPEQGSSVAAVMLCKTQVHIGFPEIVMGAYVDLQINQEMQLITKVDPKAPWILGYSEDDMMNENPIIFKHPTELPWIGSDILRRKILNKLIADGEITIPWSKFLSGWGQWLWMCLHVVPETFRDGKIYSSIGRIIITGAVDIEESLPTVQHKETEQQVHTESPDVNKDVDEILSDFLATANTPLALTHTTTNTSTTSLPSSNSQSSSDTSSPLCPNSSLADPSESSSCFSVGSSAGLTCTPPPSLDQALSPPVHSPSLVDSTESSGVFSLDSHPLSKQAVSQQLDHYSYLESLFNL